jgi:dTDP-glucose pyrophosphorylase
MMQILMPMAGSGQPFDASGQIFPKALVELFSHPLVEYAVASVKIKEDSEFIFVISEADQNSFHLDAVLGLLVPDCTIVATKGPTGGALCSALLAIDHLNPKEPLIVCNGDQFLEATMDEALSSFRQRDLDVGILTFQSVHPRWSFALVGEDGFVSQTAEKQPISKDATVGIYYYKTASLFLEAAADSLRKNSSYDGQFYVCPSINEIILAGGRVGVHEVSEDAFIPLGTPEDVERFKVLFRHSPLD